jgi:hypothetical protein
MIHISADKTYNLRFRNALLRVYISSDKKRIINEYSNKIIVKTKSKFNEYYNKLLSKYYDVSLFYNSLTDEEKEILETIISLCY